MLCSVFPIIVKRLIKVRELIMLTDFYPKRIIVIYVIHLIRMHLSFPGKIEMIRSCGIEGFKNARKGTNIAAQTTAIGLGSVSILILLQYITFPKLNLQK